MVEKTAHEAALGTGLQIRRKARRSLAAVGKGQKLASSCRRTEAGTLFRRAGRQTLQKNGRGVANQERRTETEGPQNPAFWTILTIAGAAAFGRTGI
jgi:hypothetical protein